MIRQYFNRIGKAKKERITWRSHEPSRIEAFSDGVFAFAVSLSIISLDVPHSFNELLDMLKGFIPFAFCYAGLFRIWFVQYKFFRRYGMHDDFTIVANSILLLMVLFFVYPLKFFCGLIYDPEKYSMSNDSLGTLFLLYGGAIGVIYLLFTLMYVNAYLKRDKLKLTPIEAFETKSFVFKHLGQFLALLVSMTMLGIAENSNAKNILPALVAAIVLTMAANQIVKKREKLFKQRFGNQPMEEPHLGAD